MKQIINLNSHPAYTESNIMNRNRAQFLWQDSHEQNSPLQVIPEMDPHKTIDITDLQKPHGTTPSLPVFETFDFPEEGTRLFYEKGSPMSQRSNLLDDLETISKFTFLMIFFDIAAQSFITLHRRTLPKGARLLTTPTCISRELIINPHFDTS